MALLRLSCTPRGSNQAQTIYINPNTISVVIVPPPVTDKEAETITEWADPILVYLIGDAVPVKFYLAKECLALLHALEPLPNSPSVTNVAPVIER